MREARYFAAIVEVEPDVKVLIAGGNSNKTSEVLDVDSGVFLPGPTMIERRYNAAGAGV